MEQDFIINQLNPDECICHGTGIIKIVDDVPYGDTYRVVSELIEPCPHCEKGKQEAKFWQEVLMKL